MKTRYIILFLSLVTIFLPNLFWAQGSPAPAQSSPIMLQGGNIHVGNGEYLEATDILFSAGKILEIGKNLPVPADIAVFDISGKEVYPGLIALNTNLGLVEIDAVRATRDFQEVGEFNPHVRSIIAYNTDSDILPTIRSNGVLIAQVTPEGGYISGESSVVQLDAWNWEDAAILQEDGIHLNWPTNYDLYKSSFPSWFSPPKEKYEDKIMKISEFMSSAAAYGKQKQTKTDLRMQAMQSVFKEGKKLYVHVDGYAEMLDAMDILGPFDLSLVIIGGEQADKISEYLKSKNIPVVVKSTHVLPSFDDDAYDARFTLPNRLLDDGLEVAITHKESWRQRNIPFQAGQAVAYGMPYETAIKSITLTPAKILGIDDRYGSLEKGKSATLIVSEGDILDMQSSIVTKAFIDGRTINLDDKQKKLYKKFSAKYGLPVQD